MRLFIGGQFIKDLMDLDFVCVGKLNTRTTLSGHMNIASIWYRDLGKSLGASLTLLHDNKGVKRLIGHMCEGQLVEVYIKHI